MAFENVDYKSLDIPAAPFSDPSIIPDFPKNKVPRHIGVIMDGNGRWAQQRGLIRTDGHQAAEPVVFDTIAGAKPVCDTCRCIRSPRRTGSVPHRKCAS